VPRAPAQPALASGAAASRSSRFLLLGAAAFFLDRAQAFFLLATVGGFQRGETGFLGLAQQAGLQFLARFARGGGRDRRRRRRHDHGRAGRAGRGAAGAAQPVRRAGHPAPACGA
jgi:hypothetical protein